MILCHKKRQAKLHSKQVEIDVVQGLMGVAPDPHFMGFRFNKRFVNWKKKCRMGIDYFNAKMAI